MTNHIIGYKAFNCNMTDNFGNAYEVGKHYHCDGIIKFQESGFHFCNNLEDVLRYFNSFEKDITICEIKAFGDISETINETENDYYGYYEMYASSDLVITKILSREEIIDHILNLSNSQICRFLSGYKLTTIEINYILSIKKDAIILNYIEYYQRGDKNVFKRTRKN